MKGDHGGGGSHRLAAHIHTTNSTGMGLGALVWWEHEWQTARRDLNEAEPKATAEQEVAAMSEVAKAEAE